MPSMKKSFFGSLFTFQPVAVEEVRNGFQEAFRRDQLAGDAPLVSYDQKTSNRRIVPMHGTVIDDPTVSYDLFSLDNDEGLVPFSDEEDSEGEGNRLQNVGYQTEVWKPAKGNNVGLLTFDVVKALSDHTGCTFSVNSHHNEVQLHGGDLSDALLRLNAMEPILSYLYHPANVHVLMLWSATENTRIDFTTPTDSTLRRIIVDPDVKSVGVWLGNKQVEQLSTYIKAAKAEQAFYTPNNLTTVTQCCSSVEPSNVWTDFTFARIGDAKNQAKLGETSAFDRLEKLDPLPVSHYMTERESHMIEQWAGHVVETADPNSIIPDAPVEEDGHRKFGRTRRVKQEEDEEEEDDGDDDVDQEPPPPPAPLLAPNSMNDALNLHFNAQKARVGRMRIKKIDEDEEEDEIQDAASISEAEEPASWTYPPPAESKGFGFPTTPSRRRPGRQRMVKVDSDEEAEDDNSQIGEIASRRSDDSTSAQPIDDYPARPRDGGSMISGQELSQSLGWDQPSVVPSSSDADKTGVSDAWDDTVYPDISSFGGVHAGSASKQKSVDLPGQIALPKVPWPDQSSERPRLLPEGWSNLPVESTRNIPLDGPQGRRGDRGRGNRGRAQEPPGYTPRAHAASPSRRDRGTVSGVPPVSHQQKRGHSNNRGARASRGSNPTGRSSGRGKKPGRGGNKFGALAADTLIDIADSDEVDPETMPSPSGFQHDHPVDRQSGHAKPPQVDTMKDGSSNKNLIDVSTPSETGNTPVPPPPGFDSFSDAGQQAENINQRDHSSMAPRHGSSLGSVRSQRLTSVPNTGAFYVNTSKPGMNLVEMSRRRVEQLQKDREEAESASSPTEKLQEDDESSTRTYHRTMNQQAKKPEQKKQSDQKRAEALSKAWGSGGSSSQTRASTSSAAASARESERSGMSAAKKKILRAKEALADSQSDSAIQEQAALQNDRFVAALVPVFSAARAFPGTLNFEIQLGQFLSPSPEGAYQPKCVTVNQWHKLYDPASGKLASAATFTNILTRNGADVDHILQLKTAKGAGARLFHPDSPGRFGIRFEFHCQGKNDEDFKLVFNSTGEYEIERPFRKIGQVNLHVPGQIWDAAAILTGSTRFPEEQALKDAAAELAKSIYIPAGRKDIEISYRLPSSNEFAVKRVVLRRISRHKCAIIDKHDIHLQVIEVQRLFVERRSAGIYLAYAARYDKMVEQMMINFEVSLVSDSIERAMAVNATLAVGDQAMTWTADSLLQKWRTKTLLEITQMVLSKIDGVGYHNVGSAVLFLNQDSARAGASAVAIGSHLPNTQQSITKAAAGMTQNTNAAAHAAVINVPGVRGGLAQPANAGYALGYGGARIPIPGLAGAGEMVDAVVPDDSASQVPEKGGAMEGKDQGQVIPGFW